MLTTLQTHKDTITFPRRPLVMGILNINDDSFSGDGCLDPAWALRRAEELIDLGADIVDVGGESARTNRSAISEDEEWNRIRPFLRDFRAVGKAARPRDDYQIFPPLLSVNTWRPSVVARAVEAGCDIINDMGGLPDAQNARHCAGTKTALLIMHSRGQPKVSHTHAQYLDVIAELEAFFEEKIALALSVGMQAEQIILDPGIDFAKQVEDNLAIFRHMEKFLRFGRPLLIPASRKGVIGRVLGIESPAKRDAGTIACVVASQLRGAAIVRVHNVAAAWQSLRAVHALTEPTT